MTTFDLPGPVKNLMPGSVDAWRGPYATVAEACSAIKNVVVEVEPGKFRNFREGKIVDIGINLPYVPHWWKEGYQDHNLVEYISDSVAATKSIGITDKYFDKANFDLIGKSYDLSGTDWLNTTSTFSGWDTWIGRVKNFDQIRFKVRTRTSPVSVIRVRVYDPATSVIHSEKTLTGLSLTANSIHDIAVSFDKSILNNENNDLRVAYLCDQPIDRYGVLTSNVYPYPAHALAKYAAGGNVNPDAMLAVAASGSLNFTNLFEFYKRSYSVGQSLVNEVKAGIPEITIIPSVKSKLDKAISEVDVFSGTESFAESTASIIDTTSIFSGLGSPIGKPTGFSHIVNKIRARTVTITSIYWQLRAVNGTGTILASGYLSVNLLPGVLTEVIFAMGSTISNPQGTELWFGYQCNQLADAYGRNPGNVFPAPTYGVSGYYINGLQSQTEWLYPTNAGTRNMWVKVGTSKSVAAPTSDFLNQIQQSIVIPPPVSAFVPNAEIILQSKLYATQGKQTNIYFDNIISSNVHLSLLEVDVICLKGSQQEKFYRFTPSAADVGTSAISITVSYQGVLLATYTGSISIAASTAGSGTTVNVNGWGDSTLANGQYQAVIISEQASDPLNIVFKGQLGTGANKHQGVSGYSYSDYGTAGRVLFKFQLSGVTSAPGIGSIYSNNGIQVTIREVNLTSGSGYVSGERTSGGLNPTSNGVLTKVSGAGDTALNFSSYTISSGNPMWNSTSNSIDYAMYLSNNGIAMNSGDWFISHLGINDVFNYTNDTALTTGIDSILTTIKAIASKVHAAVGGIKVGIAVPIMPAKSQDAFGSNYGAGQNRRRYVRNIQALQKRIILEFDKDSERAAGNYLIPFNAVLDTENNFPKTYEFPNSRAHEFIFKVTGTPALTIDAVYLNNGSQFKIVAALINTVITNRISGTNSPIASGVLTKSSGGGDTTINFTDVTPNMVLTMNNAVHPAQPGYDQLGDAEKDVIKNLL